MLLKTQMKAKNRETWLVEAAARGGVVDMNGEAALKSCRLLPPEEARDRPNRRRGRLLLLLHRLNPPWRGSVLLRLQLLVLCGFGPRRPGDGRGHRPLLLGSLAKKK